VRNLFTRVTCGGAPVYVWPGGGITLMVDVTRMPDNSFGYVPTPALVAPIEFTLARDEYVAIGGYTQNVVRLEDAFQDYPVRSDVWSGHNPWPLNPSRNIEI
jgi:hypothetical protein